MLRIARVACLSLAVLAMTATILPAQTVPKTAEERKAAAEAAKQQREAKKLQAEQKRKDDEAERKAKAEFQKSIQPQAYEFPEQGFRYKSPLGWRAEHQAAFAAGEAFSHKLSLVGLPVNPKDTAPREAPIHVIQVVNVPANTSLDLFAERYVASSGAKDGWTVDPATDTTLAGVPAKLVNMRTKAAPGAAPTEVIRQRSTLAIHNGRAYILQVAASTQLFPRASGGADQMAKSFEWTESDATTKPAATTQAADPTKVTSVVEDLGLRFARPNAWTEPDPIPAANVAGMFYLAETANSPGNIAEHVLFIPDQMQPGDKDARGYLERMRAAERKMYPGIQSSDITDTTVDGVPAATSTSEFEVGAFKNKRLYVTVVRGEDAIVIIFVGDPEAFDKHLPAVQEALATIRWLQQDAETTTN